MNQTKNDILNNNVMTLKTHLNYDTAILELNQYWFMQNELKLYVSLQKNETYFSQRKASGWCALWTSMSNMWISVLVTAMLHETCKKK